MAGRFYRAPINPGYDQFGAAIANAIGNVSQGWSRQQELNKEEERYQDQQARLDAQQKLIADNLEFERLRQGYTAVDPAELVPQQITPVEFGPIETAINLPAVGGVGMAQGAKGGAGIGLQAGAAPATVTGAMGVQAPDQPIKFDVPAATQALPQVTEPDMTGIVRAGDKAYRFDPAKSEQILSKRAEFALQTEVQDAARGKVRSFVERALADEKFDVKEIAEAEELGISWEKLMTPEMREKEAQKAADKAWDVFKKTEDYKFGHDKILRSMNVGGGANGLTAGQANAIAVKNVSGLASMEVFRPGATAASVYKTLEPYADQVGGKGVLIGIITNAMVGKSPLTVNQAYERADANLEEKQMYPGNEGYRAAREAEKNRILLENREFLRAQSDIWNTATTPPAAPTAADITAPANRVAAALSGNTVAPTTPRVADSPFMAVPQDGKTPAQRRADEIRAANPGISAADVVKKLKAEKLVK